MKKHTICSCDDCVKQNGEIKSVPNKIVAILFALFFGGLGIHKFYLNKFLAGAMYILFCWTLLPAVIAFFEAIVFMSMDDKQWAEKYGRR